MASSFQPPTANDSVPAADDSVPAAASYPPWVLLDKRIHFAHQENAPTSKVKTRTDQEVEISFCVDHPPGISKFCAHSPQIPIENFTSEASVVSSAGNLVLLRFAYKTCPRSSDVDPDLVEFFVCKFGSGGNLSTEPVRCSPTGTRHSKHAGIVPLDGGHFLVADLFQSGQGGRYDLHVFSSETSKWTMTHLQPADGLPRDLPSQPDKVISLGRSLVGWVDLWRGIVFCDVREKEPVLRFIPLPTTTFDPHRNGKAQRVRDVTWCDYFINFVEIEHCFRELSIGNQSVKTTSNLDTEDVIFDEALLTPELVPDGWKIRTMYKAIPWHYWKKRHTVHVDDISAVQEHSVLPPQLRNDGATEWTLRNLKTTGFPCYGVYGHNVVYLVSKVDSNDKDSWIVGVDLQKKKLEVIKPYCSASGSSFDPTVLPCAFSEYMNTTPRSYKELVAAIYSQEGVLNNHLPLGDTVPVASSAQNVLANGHLSSGSTVTDNVQHQNTVSVDGCYARSNGSGFGAHSGYDNYQQPTPLQPSNLPPTVQPMSSLTQSASASSLDQTVLPCAFSDYMSTTPRPYDELVAASYSQHGVLNNHLPLGDTIPVASRAQNAMPNGHLSLGSTVLDNVQPQLNTLDVDGYHGSFNGSGSGAHSGYGKYQQPTPLQPPNSPPTVQPMSSSTRSGYIYVYWTVPDRNGKMLVSVPLIGRRPVALPLILPTPFSASLAPRPAPSSQTFAPLMTAGGRALLSHGFQHHVKPFPSYTQGAELDNHGELPEADYYC